MRLASRSLWKTSSPLSGHLTQRFSGVSRRSNERIFGGTTFEIQFMRGFGSGGSVFDKRSLLRGAYALRQFADKLSRGDDGRRGRRSTVQRKSYRLDDGRTDHHAVRGLRDRPGAFGVLDPEPDCDWQLRPPLEARHGFAHQLNVRRCRPGDSGDRNKIDEAAGVSENLRQTIIAGGGRHQTNKSEPRFARGQANLIVFLGRAIDDDQPVDPRRLRVGQERLDPIDVNGVVIAHQDERRVRIPCAELLHHFEGRWERLVGLQRSAAGALNRRAVRNRVAKRHAEFDNVRAGRWQGGKDSRGGLGVRIAGHDEGQKRGPAFGCDPLKAQIEACGHELLVTTMTISAKAGARRASSLAVRNKPPLDWRWEFR